MKLNKWFFTLGLLMFSIFLASMSYGADVVPLTADTVAAPVPFWQPIIKEVLTGLFKFALGLFFTWITGIYDASRKYVAKTKYGQECGILMESLRVAISKKAKAQGRHYKDLVAELISIGSDLEIDPRERVRLKEMSGEIGDDAVEIAQESFKNLRGFAKDKGGKYIAERIDVLLGELQSHLLGSKKS